MVSKTREKLIDVARQLFAKQGVEKTTMNDIAEASDKGRRTIYTYFKNKRDIYNAVIEREADLLVESLRVIASSQLPPVEKLEKFLYQRFEVVREKVHRPDGVKALLSLVDRRVERIRLRAYHLVNQMLQGIIREGVNQGVFDPKQAEALPALLDVALIGADTLYLRDGWEGAGVNPMTFQGQMVSFVIEGLLLEPRESEAAS
ncbi:MAG: TetR/AcrR family transcriptional regulator [Bacteroidales bacterium]|nr:TetR/AcrR family transcriptional regulator [Bacteroidales bacterium]MCD8394715.1 TetR/AcrR family transcriptional regulator [Bacteroidales bacterium]